MTPPANATLQQISTEKVRKNPENPRLIFREGQMNQLLESIKEVGIRVPISVYRDGARYFLIDGERRWRCAKRLNLKSMPAVVQPKPDRLTNLLMMFNIHNVRVDWDPMPMALKLKDVKELLEKKQGKEIGARELSAETGVPFASVRRALDLLDLPQKYQRLLLQEAEKPRHEQRIKPDLFIEIYKSLHAIERYAPEVLEAVPKPKYVDSMVQKYLDGVIDNVVRFREVSKMARAERAGVDKESVVPTLIKLAKTRDYGIQDAFESTVQEAYQRRDLMTRLGSVLEALQGAKRRARIEPELQRVLEAIKAEIERLLAR